MNGRNRPGSGRIPRLVRLRPAAATRPDDCQIENAFARRLGRILLLLLNDHYSNWLVVAKQPSRNRQPLLAVDGNSLSTDGRHI